MSLNFSPLFPSINRILLCSRRREGGESSAKSHDGEKKVGGGGAVDIDEREPLPAPTLSKLSLSSEITISSFRSTRNLFHNLMTPSSLPRAGEGKPTVIERCADTCQTHKHYQAASGDSSIVFRSHYCIYPGAFQQMLLEFDEKKV